LRYRSFGKTGIEVSEIGFGCARLGGVFGESATRQASIRVLQGALDRGITFFDTADMYTQGESETLLGLAFRRQRDKVVIASKGGYCLPAQRQLIQRVKPLIKPLVRYLGIRREHLPSGAAGALSQNFTPKYLAERVEASLRRLKTDYLDLYQLHSPPPDAVDSERCIETLEQLKRAGKIRHYGIAADTVDDAREFLRYPTIASLQVPFGLLDQAALGEFLALAEARGIAVIGRGCFAAGLLKAEYTEAQLRELTPKWPQIMALRQIAERRGRSVLELALQFSLHTRAVAVTLLGMRTPAHLADNLQHFAAAALSDEEYRELAAPEATA